MSVKVNINGNDYEFDEDLTILEACKKVNLKIPHLCNIKDMPAYASCRMCVVEVEGSRTLVTSCSTKLRDGMVVKTKSKRVLDARKFNLQLLMANHVDCISCKKNMNCKLQRLASDHSIKERCFSRNTTFSKDLSSVSYSRNNDLCILCGKCVRICANTQYVGVIDFIGRGHTTEIGYAYNKKIGKTECINCGQCVLNCPTGALVERFHVDYVTEALENPNKFVVVQFAPTIRVSLGEIFGNEPGTNVTGKMVSAARKMGFDKVFDTGLGADMTVMEEGNEIYGRIANGGKLPILTSCCPGWVNYVEHFYPDYVNNLSTAKSPAQMVGALSKEWYAQSIGIDPNNMVVVSVMPCVAKKDELARPEMQNNGRRNVDYTLTTREFGRMIKEFCVNFNELHDEEFDIFGTSTGAGDMFAASGGVSEAVLRTIYETKTGDHLDKLEFEQIRGLKGIKEGSIELNGIQINFAVTSGIANARKLMEEVVAGKSKYHIIEVMACPGGCIGGGGQPIPTNKERIQQRMASVYSQDSERHMRRSHENEIVKKIYDEFLGEPNSELAEELLHVKHFPRVLYEQYYEDEDKGDKPEEKN